MKIPLWIRSLVILAGLVAANCFATTIPVNNAAFLAGLPPGDWVTSGSSYVQNSNAGAYFKVNFTGTSFGIAVDVSSMVSQGYVANTYPILKWSVDGGSFTSYQLTPTDTTVTLATGLSNSTHSIYVISRAYDGSGSSNRWNGNMSLKITGLVVDTGKTLAAATLRTGGTMLVFGDSISAGFNVFGTGNPTPQYQDSDLGYQSILAGMMNVEYADCAFEGQSWEGSGFMGVPNFPNSWNLILSGVTRTFSPQPNFVMINMGTNGGVNSSFTVYTMLSNLRTACGANCRIFLIIPFDQNGVTNLTAGFNSWTTANPGDKSNLFDLGTTGANVVINNSYDGLHPNVTGQQLEAALLWPLISPYVGHTMTATTLTATNAHIGP